MVRKGMAVGIAGLLASSASILAAQDKTRDDVVVTGTKGGSGWYEASSKHFVVYSNDTAQNVGRYAVRLERFDKAVRVLHNSPEDRRGNASRVTVFVVPTMGDIQNLIHRDNVGGFFQARMHPVAFMPKSSGEARDYGMSPQLIMFHEYTHHWMLTTWTDAAFPAWYTEGAAELHATAIVRDSGVTFGAAPVSRRDSVARSDLMPSSLLLRAIPGKLSDQETAGLYARGWLLTHYLTFDKDRRKLLADYVLAINSGKSIDEAARILGGGVALDGKLNGYGSRQSLPAVTIPVADLPIGPVTVRALSAGEAAVMPLKVRSQAGVNKSDAASVVTAARRLSAQYPDDAAVQNELAEAEYDAAQTGPKDDRAAGYARAAAAANRAIAADPKSIHALLYKGMAEQALAVDAKRKDADTWKAIRQSYLAANRLDTEDPEPLVDYYRSFAAADQPPTAGATKGLFYAYALAPHDAQTRALATAAYLRDDKLAEARIAIGPIAYRPDLAGAERYRKVLAAIDAKDSKAALSALTAKTADGKPCEPSSDDGKCAE